MSDLSQLICLPPAGAGPSLFRPWQQNDPTVIAPAIPGREALFRARPLPDLATLAEDIAKRVAAEITPGYGLFGYSLGGTLAYLLAERLVARGLPAPEVVFTLGALAPHRLGGGIQDILTLDGNAFWDEIARIGGTPPEILNDPELRAFFEPGLRADFRLCKTYQPPKRGFRLPCPIEVFVADRDHLVGSDSAADWSEYTRQHVCLNRIAGGHMLNAVQFKALLGRIRKHWPEKVST
ncbi:thioesterase [Pseudorhodobacter turbinis]|uniref:Thioesterase n=1 Tax=Pseudorhodobacter turbinis TaxID=2500533 RepID=A0A4P8EFT2_9RHOB|nr:alpha/beta fold hydrolase [Pseudorhodobacter turbinis]QCO55736.1 thioesterase [Pseudorhodobacter turbinis]